MIRRILPCLVLAASVTLASPPCFADETPQQRQADVHFQRAVQLYSETDYRAALVEFKRAYEIAPHVTVLYNIGQSHYQLQAYAEALTAFERFLAEGGTLHRQEVENAVAVLRTRVGKVDVTTPSPGWDVSVDEEVVGKTPLPRPLAVSIGRRRISVARPGETTVTRLVDVGAGETVPVPLGGAPTAPGVATTRGPEHATSTEPPAPSTPSQTPIIVAWSLTGVFAAAGAVTGVLALSKASSLKDERERYPVTRSDLEDRASSTTALTVTTDILLGAAIIGAGVSLYLTLARPNAARTTALRAAVSGQRFVLGGTF